jgi:TetR/AcrR family transcriptional regulator, regulator of cefoperazone and chloramphenicol sensitivity
MTRLPLAERLFHYKNVSSAREDLTAAAAIRIAAMELFAERAYADVTVRQIAAAAGVSAALVIHHYGSKDSLRAVLEERVAAFVEAMLAELARAPDEGGSASVAQLFADRLEREPAMAGFIRRLLCDGGPAGVALFQRLYQTTRTGMQALEQAGVVRPARDEAVRSAFLLANDLAMLLLRPHITRVTRIDPLSRDGFVRWSAEVVDVYSGGVFVCAPVPAALEANEAHVKGNQEGADR